MKKSFPTFPVILLVISILWLINDLKIIEINVPWIPVVLIIVALGWIINSYTK